MSALDRHIRKALFLGQFEFTDRTFFRSIAIGKIELCKDYRDRWYFPTGLEGGVELSWLTRACLDLVRMGWMRVAGVKL